VCTLRNVVVIIIFTGSYSKCFVSTTSHPSYNFPVALRADFSCHVFPSRGFVITLIERTTICRSSLDERSARRIDRYLTTHKSHKTQISVSPARFKPAIPARQQRKNHALDRADTGIGHLVYTFRDFLNYLLEIVMIAPERENYNLLSLFSSSLPQIIVLFKSYA
jgi:hypothetical protein